MKNKKIDNIKSKSVVELDHDIVALRNEIEKYKMEKKTNPAKDTNSIAKKKRSLARLLTILNEKKIVDSL